MIFVRCAEVNHSQRCKDESLQRNHQDVEDSPGNIQRPLDPDVELPIATGNGTYESTFHTLGVSLGYSWGAPDEDDVMEDDSSDD